jgi:hypothetical protein
VGQCHGGVAMSRVSSEQQDYQRDSPPNEKAMKSRASSAFRPGIREAAITDDGPRSTSR